MQVFLMWAGEASHEAARALKAFLEFVVRGPDYFISDDIEGGKLWRTVIANQLEGTNFGIACLTRDNLRSHWLHFEAGALSKAMGQANVVPYLIGPKSTDVEGPLADFQMVTSDESGTRKLVSLLATQAKEPNRNVIERSFGYEWPTLEAQLNRILTATTDEASSAPPRTEAALVQEILERIRRVESRLAPKIPPPPVSSPVTRNADDEMLAAMMARVAALIDEIEPDAYNSTMEDMIKGWRNALKQPMSLEQILDVYQEARRMEAHINR